MPIARIEPSGCGEFHGNVVARIAFYLGPDDARYDERHYLVPVIPKGGYPGEVDAEGSPVDQADYDAWIGSLPKKWVLAPFHNHFLYLPPDVTEDIIVAKANLHLPNFYAAWLQELDKVKGGMRKGWAIETRARPIRYDKTDPELYAIRKPQCLEKAQLIRALAIEARGKEGGQLFPASVIDVGAAAIGRASSLGGDRTVISKENPANDTGPITDVEVYFLQTTQATTYANFEEVNGATFTARDREVVGIIAGGSKQTSSGLDMDVVTGDYIGLHWLDDEDYIEKDNSGDGYWYVSASDQTQCVSQLFTFLASRTISLYGTGGVVGIQDKSANMGAKMIAGKLI